MSESAALWLLAGACVLLAVYTGGCMLWFGWLEPKLRFWHLERERKKLGRYF